MGDDLGFNNIQKHGKRGKSYKITNMIRVKGSEKRPFIFVFWLNIVLCDSYQAYEIVMEIEEWKQKVSEDYVKSFGRGLLGALETSSILKKLYIRWIFLVLQQFDLS